MVHSFIVLRNLLQLTQHLHNVKLYHIPSPTDGIILFDNPVVAQQPLDCNNPLRLRVLGGLSPGKVPDPPSLL